MYIHTYIYIFSIFYSKEETSIEDDDEEEDPEEVGSKRARRDSSSSLGSSLSMEMPPLFSNGVVGQTTSHLVSRETDLSLNSLLSRSQSIFGHATSSTTIASTASVGAHQGSKMFSASQPSLPPQKRNSNQKTVVNEAQSSLSSSLHMLKRPRADSSSDSDSFDENTDEYGDESTNKKIHNVSGIVAPVVYHQKKKRQKLIDKSTSTAAASNNVKRVAFVDDSKNSKKDDHINKGGEVEVVAGTSRKIILPSISDMVNTSITAKTKSPEKSPVPLITNPKHLEHDRSMDEKRVENLLTAFETEEETKQKKHELKDTPKLGETLNSATLEQLKPTTTASVTSSSQMVSSTFTLSLPITTTATVTGGTPKGNFSFGAAATSEVLATEKEPKAPIASPTSTAVTTKPEQESTASAVSKPISFEAEAFGFKKTAITSPSAAIGKPEVLSTPPKPSVNFSFGTNVAVTTTTPTVSVATVTPSISFSNAPDVTKSTGSSGFSFGAVTTSSVSVPSTSFSFSSTTGGTTNTATSLPSINSSSTFTFGAPATSSVTPSTTSTVEGGIKPSFSFSFGGDNSKAKTDSVPSLFGTFGNPPATTSTTNSAASSSAFSSIVSATTTASGTSGTFSFGKSSTLPSAFGSTTVATASTTSATPSFGGFAKPTVSEAPSFSFGGASEKKADSGFSFGEAAKKDAPNSSVFSFGTSGSTSVTTSFTTPKTSSTTSNFSFGSKTETPKQGSFSFGGSKSTTNNTSSSGMFQFGTSSGNASSTSSAPPSNTFQFGKTDAAPQPTKSFSFGGSTSNTQSNDMFKFSGASNSNTSNFNFGTSKPSSNPTPTSFGAEPPAKALSIPQFGSANETKSQGSGGGPGVFTFGSGASNTSSPATGVFQFGASASATSAPVPNAVPSFGQASSLPSFGAAPANNPQTQGGFNFGSAAANPTSFSFGSNAPSAPSFGVAPDQNKAPGGFNFGTTSPGMQNQFMTQSQPPPVQQPGGSMFSIGTGSTQPPKGRTIARARRTRR